MDLVRSFVAIELPERVRSRLAEVERRLRRSAEPGVKWVDPAGIHLTLKFLGNVPPSRLEQIEAALRGSVPGHLPVRLNTGEVGAFPSARAPRVVWVGLGGDLRRLGELQAAVEDSLEQLGFAREARAFAPHLTLGRTRDTISAEERRRLSEALAALGSLESVTFEVAAIVLMRSQLTPRGAVYSPLASIGA